MSNEHKTFADFKQQIVDEMKMLETDLSFYSKMTSFQIESHHDFESLDPSDKKRLKSMIRDISTTFEVITSKENEIKHSSFSSKELILKNRKKYVGFFIKRHRLYNEYRAEEQPGDPGVSKM